MTLWPPCIRSVICLSLYRLDVVVFWRDASLVSTKRSHRSRKAATRSVISLICSAVYFGGFFGAFIMPCRQEARLPLRRLLFLSSWSKVLCSPRNFHDFTSLRSGLIQSDHIRKNRPTCSRRPVNSRATQSWTCESTAELAIRNRGIDRWLLPPEGFFLRKKFSRLSLIHI